jgi:hypothetical protein
LGGESRALPRPKNSKCLFNALPLLLDLLAIERQRGIDHIEMSCVVEETAAGINLSIDPRPELNRWREPCRTRKVIASLC